MITRGKGGWGQVEEGIGGINGDGKVLDLAGEHTIQFIDNVLQNCRPETYIILLTNVTPIKLIQKLKKMKVIKFRRLGMLTDFSAQAYFNYIKFL